MQDMNHGARPAKRHVPSPALAAGLAGSGTSAQASTTASAPTPSSGPAAAPATGPLECELTAALAAVELPLGHAAPGNQCAAADAALAESVA
jgi:hypothetical protein